MLKAIIFLATIGYLHLREKLYFARNLIIVKVAGSTPNRFAGSFICRMLSSALFIFVFRNSALT
ncbi:MAG: hypothetical protein REH83_05600, partial [Rickettsiella sp.]|nr:hypothetical protein [Rickettsiella sp.]